MKTAYLDRMLVAAGMLAAGALWTWFVTGRGEPGRTAEWEEILPGDPVAAITDRGTTPVARWSAAAVVDGRKRSYELFTPPPLALDAKSGRMVVREITAEAAGAEPADGLELLSVEQPLFRVQLVGYVGDGMGCRGLFEDVATAETFLAGGGEAVPKLEFEVERLELQPMAVMWPGGGRSRQRIAIATLRDWRAGGTINLRSDERCRVGPVRARVRMAGEDQPRDVAEGETLAAGRGEITIRRIQLAPPRLRLALKTSEGRLEERELTEATP